MLYTELQKRLAEVPIDKQHHYCEAFADMLRLAGWCEQSAQCVYFTLLNDYVDGDNVERAVTYVTMTFSGVIMRLNNIAADVDLDEMLDHWTRLAERKAA